MKLIIFLKFKLIFLIFIFISLSKILTPIRILICTVAKQENKYIKEYVEHYRKLKIKKIIIYDNNEINGEKFEDVIKNEIKDNFIKIINYRGIAHPQNKALNDCYKRMNHFYDWIAFFDVDEFLYIINYTTISEFLSLSKFNQCQSILINWKFYGDNNKLYYEEKSLNERFNEPINITININFIKDKYFFSAAKTIVRGGLNLNWGLFPHYLINLKNCRPDGTILKNYFSPYQHSIAYIKHYITKSTEEFIERLNRGDVLVEINKDYILNRINNYYFLFNKKTKKKLYLFNNYLKKKNFTEN